MRARFIKALEAVGGNAIEVAAGSDEIQTVAGLVRSLNIRSAAIGEGITTDSSALAMRLTGEGSDMVRNSPNGEMPAFILREKLAKVEAGIVEADYAIAATGTLALIGGPKRPRSLSLLPPISIVLLRTARILPDLATMLRAVGAERIGEHPMVLVTGPSRTADIEKRIVIGVHGPKQLHVVMLDGGGEPVRQ